jgi:transcriptional regulator MraZ
VFRGLSLINLDAKGRLAIPTKYRAELQECCDCQLVVTADRDGCLLLYPLPEWEVVERKLAKLPTLNKKARALQRFMIGHACECQMDGQGRILLSDGLRSFANLDKRVALLGQLNKFEIWNEEAWRGQQDSWLQEGESAELEGLDLESFSY